MWTISTPTGNNFFTQEYAVDFKEPKEETTEDWADKWMKENER